MSIVEVGVSTSLPMALHDYPASFGISLGVDLIGRLARDGVAPYIKAEDPPVIGKQRRVLAAAGGRIGSSAGWAARGSTRSWRRAPPAS